MKCLKSKRLLIEYADGRLQDELCEELESHLNNCYRCRSELKELEMSLQLVMETADEDVPTPSAAFIPELKRRIEKLNSETDVKVCPERSEKSYLNSRINSGIQSFVWPLSRKLITQPKIWATAAIAILLILSSMLFLPQFDKDDRSDPSTSPARPPERSEGSVEEGTFLSPAELQKITDLPEGQTLIEMLPISRPYIYALLEAQEEKKARKQIISTIDNVNPQLWERVIKLLEVSAAALESSEFEEEGNLSWDDEEII